MKKAVLGWLGSMHEILDATFGGFFDFIDDRQIIRRGIVLILLYQVVDVYLWAKNYALMPGKSGAELSVVIAALIVPVSFLQGFLFKIYDEGRNKQGSANVTSGDVNVTVASKTS